MTYYFHLSLLGLQRKGKCAWKIKSRNHKHSGGQEHRLKALEHELRKHIRNREHGMVQFLRGEKLKGSDLGETWKK